jgi:nucleotide-binding universal stress UspA family protein
MFKTILVHVDLSAHAPARIRHAGALAQAHGALLLGAAMFGVSRAIFPSGYTSAPGTLCASYFDPLADNARRALAQFGRIAHGLQVEYAARFVCDQADAGLVDLARFADLVVVSQDDPDEALEDMPVQLPEHLILSCARPVLVVPRTDPPPCPGGHVMVAWDGSKEASCAMGAALPLLRQAGAVTVATLTPAGGGGDADIRAQEPDLVHFLGRHGIAPRMLRRPAGGDTGGGLLALAGDMHCSTLVMGCYGHSRLRELCLGGASRTVLADARIPVLMAH